MCNIILFIAAMPLAILAQPAAPNNFALQVTVALPNSDYVEYCSPTLADLDTPPDGQLEIIFGTKGGWIYAYNGNGTQRWAFYTGNLPRGMVPIESSAAVGDINNDGYMEVVIGMGGHQTPSEYQHHGGVVALRHNGQLIAGWPQYSGDKVDSGMVGPDGYADMVFSSPALGDLDNNGDLEIVVGSLDEHVYAWHHDGTAVNGWPAWVRDTVWSSPALGDVDKDGHLEVVIGTDTHSEVEPVSTTAGGYLYVFDHTGGGWSDAAQGWNYNWRVWEAETIMSSPALADLNGDGWLEIIYGAGWYYAWTGNISLGKVVNVLDYRNRTFLTGWPQATDGQTFPSPAIGDIDNDGQPEIVISDTPRWDMPEYTRIYAWDVNGTLKWKIQPQTLPAANSFRVTQSPILADYDGNGTADVFMDMNWSGLVYNGASGVLLNENFSQPGPIASSPAVGNVDDDANLEMVAVGKNLEIWQLSSTSSDDDWPMFRHDAQHTGLYDLPPALQLSSQSLRFDNDITTCDDPTAQMVSISNSGGGTLEWSASSSAAWLSVSPTSGTGDGTLTISVDRSTLNEGTLNNGSINVTATDATNSPQTIQVTYRVGWSPVFSADKYSFEFVMDDDGSNPAAQTMTIRNNNPAGDNCTLQWSASEAADWLTLSPASGNILAGQSTTVRFSVDKAGQTAGTLSESVTFNVGQYTQNPDSISPASVSYEIFPILRVIPGHLSFLYEQTDTVPTSIDTTVEITNVGAPPASSLDWSASLSPGDASWLSISPSSGAVAGSATVTVDTTGITDERGAITFSSDAARADVELSVRFLVGTLQKVYLPLVMKNYTAPVVATPTTTPTSNTAIVFASNRDGDHDIYTMSDTGTNVTALTNNEYEDRNPVWSTGKDKICYAADPDGDTNYDIYTIAAIGGTPTNVTNNSATNDWMCVWAPDATQLAIQSQRDDIWDIYIINSTTGAVVRNLTDNSRNDFTPRWGSNGKIVFWSDRDASTAWGAFNIYTVDATGGTPMALFTQPSAWYALPSWNFDHNTILFQSNESGNWVIYKYVLSTSEQTPLTAESISCEFARWSPDGTEIVFECGASSSKNIYKMNANGTGKTWLTDTEGNDSDPDW